MNSLHLHKQVPIPQHDQPRNFAEETDHHTEKDTGSKRTRSKPQQDHHAAKKKLRFDGSVPTQLISMQVFHEMAGSGKTNHFKQKELRARVKTSVQARSGNTRRRKSTFLELDSEDEEELPISQAVSGALTTMLSGGRSSLEQSMGEQYDPLEQYALLHNAMCEVDHKDLPASTKEKLKGEFKEMLDDLMLKHHDAIRRGLNDSENLGNAVQAMAGVTSLQHASLRELRFLYGAKGNGFLESPLSPMAMGKALHQKFGAENFSSALSSLRTRMASGFRVDDRKGMAPQLWLCMSDAAAFNAVQSTFGVATELRRDLINKANVLPRSNHASMTMALLSIAESGKSKIPVIASQIYDAKDADDLTKGRVYKQIQHAVRQLPTTLWPFDKMSLRAEVIEELGKNIAGGHKPMPVTETSAERLEREWRTALGHAPAEAHDAVHARKGGTDATGVEHAGTPVPADPPVKT